MAFLSKYHPKNDTLLITFDSSDQSAAAKAVLDRTLPQGYIIAQQDNNSQAMQWLTRLRITLIASDNFLLSETDHSLW